jgi:type I restriction enzyme M protein
MFEQAFKNIDDGLWKEAGCTTELDYTEQTSWLLFLKYLDSLEQDKAMEAELEGKKYTFIKEKESLAYVIAIMNTILHGIEAPNVIHTNTLAENISDIQDKDRFDIILANPPFGGKERPEVQQNFPIKTGERFLFLQHFIKSLKAGGRAAIVIKNTFLSNSDGAARALRQELLENCNLHTVLDCPGGPSSGPG